MAYRVLINQSIATVNDGVWSCPNPKLQTILNNWLEIEKTLAINPDHELFWLGSPAVGDSDWLIANLAVKDFNGKLLDKLLPPPPLIYKGKTLKDSEVVY